MPQTELMELHEVPEVAARFVRQEPIPDDSEQAAPNTCQNMCETATGYGPAAADVIRALLRPVLLPARGCDCWECKSGQGERNEEQIPGITLPVC